MTTTFKILADGSEVDANDPRIDHVAITDLDLGLMICVTSIGSAADNDQPASADEVLAQCRALDLLGYTDWRPATRAEGTRLIDDTRSEPAINTDLYPRIRAMLHWLDTMLFGSEESWWSLYASYGGTTHNPANLLGYAIAVRDITPSI